MDHPIGNALPQPPSGKTGWPWIADRTPLPALMENGAPWPKITIVTPSYNQGPYLEETIRSILQQGYPNLEYIMMDGGSTDDSVEIIQKYAPWLSYVHIGPDGGQSAAIGEGFRHANGEILAWLNSDDYYLPNSLARVANFFGQHTNIGFANGDIVLVDSSSQSSRRQYSVKPNRFITVNSGYHGWPQQGCFWRKSVYDAVGGIDESLHFCMDRDLFIRLTGKCKSSRIPGPPLAAFRLHDEAKSTVSLDVGDREHKKLLAKYGNKSLMRHPRLFRYSWQVWRMPTRIRRKTNKILGWEW